MYEYFAGSQMKSNFISGMHQNVHTKFVLTLYKIQYFRGRRRVVVRSHTVARRPTNSTNLKESTIKIVNTISGCEKINFGLANMVVSRGAESRATLI